MPGSVGLPLSRTPLSVNQTSFQLSIVNYQLRQFPSASLQRYSGNSSKHPLLGISPCFRQSSASFEGSFRIIRKPDSLSLIIMMTFRLFFPTMVSISPNPRTVLSRRRLKVFVLSRHVLVSPLTYRKNHAYYSVSPLWRRCMYRGFPHLSQIGR